MNQPYRANVYIQSEVVKPLVDAVRDQNPVLVLETTDTYYGRPERRGFSRPIEERVFVIKLDTPVKTWTHGSPMDTFRISTRHVSVVPIPVYTKEEMS
jgi:pyruvate/2-oxoglutarate/acetoin dehydrogenase E1 component